MSVQLIYIGGYSLDTDDLALIGITFGRVEATLKLLRPGTPHRLETLLALPGTQADVDAAQATFKLSHLHGIWFRPTPDLRKHIADAKLVRLGNGTSRISLDLAHTEFEALADLCRERKAKSKAALLRTAFRVYQELARLEADGFTLQVSKGTRVLRFPGIDAVAKETDDAT